MGIGVYHFEITCVRELQCNYTVISRVVFQLHVICQPYCTSGSGDEPADGGERLEDAPELDATLVSAAASFSSSSSASAAWSICSFQDLRASESLTVSATRGVAEDGMGARTQAAGGSCHGGQ